MAGLVVLFVESPAQEITPSALTIFRYGNGRSGYATQTSTVGYTEGLTDIRIGLPRNIAVGVRFLYDEPPEIGPRFKGISRRWVEYAQDGISVRAGNSSELFGRGLALNLFEDRGLGYDTWLDGVKAGYTTSFVRATLVAGQIAFWDSIVVARTEEYTLHGGNIELLPARWLVIGTGFIAADGTIPQPGITQSLHAEIPEVYGIVRCGPVDAFVGWSGKWTNIPTESATSTGSGVYGALSWSAAMAGVTIDYKNYRYDIRDPLGAFDATRPSRMLPFQNPPTVQREYSSTFLTRQLHQVDFNDEVGLQAEATIAPDDAMHVTVNASLASRHCAYAYRPATFDFVREDRSWSGLPSTDDALSPYHEFFLEGEQVFDNGTVLRLAVARREAVLAVRYGGSVNDHVMGSTVIPLHVTVPVVDALTLQADIEQEWVNDNYNVARERFSNTLVGITLTQAPTVSLSGRVEVTSNPSDLSGRKAWFAGEVGYRIAGRHSIVVTCGQERGGQVCMNGVCRYVRPFNGVRVLIQSIL